MDKRDEIIVRVVDPDLWRNVGWPEDPTSLHGFRGQGLRTLPVYRPAARLRRRAPEIRPRHPRTQRTSPVAAPPRSSGSSSGPSRSSSATRRIRSQNVVLFAPVLSHYVQDAYQPFHAYATTHDGIQASQRGTTAASNVISSSGSAIVWSLTRRPPEEPITKSARRVVRRAARELISSSARSSRPIRPRWGPAARYDDPAFTKRFCIGQASARETSERGHRRNGRSHPGSLGAGRAA